MRSPVDRARSLLRRPGGWIEGQPGPDGPGAPYSLRIGPTRRARVNLVLDEAAFRALIAEPGLRPRNGGGWEARATGPEAAPDTAPGRPGLIEGHREVMSEDGTLTAHRANLGESPIAWLARRRDASGRPWLSPAEVAAGERLRLDAERAASGPSVTMRWDALPRSGGGSSARVEPGDRALSASARIDAALNAVSPRVRALVVRICLNSSSLQLAERELGLRRRQGKTLLKEGLQALAEHYGIG
ncbi:DUF6456 domain-containing protein [soil metagenome]